MIRNAFVAAAFTVAVAFASGVPLVSPAQASSAATTTVCMPFSPGWMLCTEYGENFAVIREYLIQDDSDVGYIF